MACSQRMPRSKRPDGRLAFPAWTAPFALEPALDEASVPRTPLGLRPRC